MIKYGYEFPDEESKKSTKQDQPKDTPKKLKKDVDSRVLSVSKKDKEKDAFSGDID